MGKVEIFGFTGSTYVRTAILACIEKGVPFVLSPVEYGQASHLALHPYGKMPAMRHGDLDLYETAAIAVYVDEAFAGAPLQPAAPAERAAMWQLVSAANAYMYGSFVQAMAGNDKPSGISDDARRSFDVLERAASESRYLIGDAPTLADLFVMPMIGFYVRMVDGGEGVLQRWPHVAAWFKRMTTRASAVQAAAA